ncbi:hypothetical protein D3C72_2037200 [compost metagenome]
MQLRQRLRAGIKEAAQALLLPQRTDATDQIAGCALRGIDGGHLAFPAAGRPG